MAKNIKKKKYRVIPDNLFSNRKIKELEDKGDGYLIFFMKFYLKAQNYCGRNFVKMKINIDPVEYFSIIFRTKREDTKRYLEFLIKKKYIVRDEFGFIVNNIISDKKRDRSTFEYIEWRKRVFSRDNFSCQICGNVGGKLNAHHIKRFADYPSLRFEVNNGITLCEMCHKKLHQEQREKEKRKNG